MDLAVGLFCLALGLVWDGVDASAELADQASWDCLRKERGCVCGCSPSVVGFRYCAGSADAGHHATGNAARMAGYPSNRK